MDRRYVILEKGRLYWSSGVGEPPSGKVDLSSPCEVRSSADGRFALKAIGGKWQNGSFTGAGTDRIFVFDASSSEHSPEGWAAALNEHIQFASKSRKTMPAMYRWMWGDAGVFGHSAARMNPGRWSSWKGLEATIVDLHAHNTSKNCFRPVELASQCARCVEIFEDIDKAITYLRETSGHVDTSSGILQSPSTPGAPETGDLEGGSDVAAEPCRARARDPASSAGASFEHERDSGDASRSLTDAAASTCTYPSRPLVDGGETPVLVEQAEGHPSVRVFALPMAGQEVIAEITSGTRAVCLAERGEFLRIRWKQLEGWVGRKNVRLLPSPPEGGIPNPSFILHADQAQPAAIPTTKHPDNSPTLEQLVEAPELSDRWLSGTDALSKLERPSLEADLLMPLLGDPLSDGRALSWCNWKASTATGEQQQRESGHSAPSTHTGGHVVSLPLTCVDDVVAAMSASGAYGPVVPTIIVTPPESCERTETATATATPEEAKIQEAQLLLASMLTPTSEKKRHCRSRRRSAPPLASPGCMKRQTSKASRRALSMERMEVEDSPLPALNGCMPSFPPVKSKDVASGRSAH